MEITKELIKKKSEHHEDVLSELEEISLHQLDIGYISPILHTLCRNIRILLLQGNYIKKIENLYHLKNLEYINLALNCIDMIENLDKCPNIHKIDLTLNFVNIYNMCESIKHIGNICTLKYIYIMGNPFCEWKYYKEYIIYNMPYVEYIDGVYIKPSDRTSAIHIYKYIYKDLCNYINDVKLGIIPLESINYNKQQRLDMYNDICKKSQNNNDKNDENSINNTYKNHLNNNEALSSTSPQEKSEKNENKLEIKAKNGCKLIYYIDDYTYKDMYVCTIHTPKYLSTHLININLYPNYIKIEIKKKITIIILDIYISYAKSYIERDCVSGYIYIYMYINNNIVSVNNNNNNENSIHNNILFNRNKNNFIKECKNNITYKNHNKHQYKDIYAKNVNNNNNNIESEYNKNGIDSMNVPELEDIC